MKIEEKIQDLREEVVRHQLALQIATQLRDVLDESVSFSPAGALWIYPGTRENLQALMTLAPKWDKDYSDEEISYTAQVEGQCVRLIARDAALPPTCHIVEIEELQPAVPEKILPAQEARIVRRRVLKCDHSDKVAPAPAAPSPASGAPAPSILTEDTF